MKKLAIFMVACMLISAVFVANPKMPVAAASGKDIGMLDGVEGLDARDINVLRHYLLGYTEYQGSPIDSSLTDVDGNGVTDIRDLVRIKRYCDHVVVKFMDYDGTTVLYEETLNYGSSSTYSGVPTRVADSVTSYTFSKWVSIPDGNEAADLSHVLGDTVVYAKYIKNTGVYASFTTDDEVNVNTSSWLGTRSSSNVKQYNGKNSLSINNTTAGGRFGCVLNKEMLTEFFALDGAISVTISFSYNASAVTGAPNYISLGLIGTKALPIVKTDSWNTYSATFDSVPANFIISVSNLADSAYSGSGVTGTLYVGDITYTVTYSTGVYASFATIEEVNNNTTAWLGTRSSSNVKQYNGNNSLSIYNTAAGGRFGCALNKNKLTGFFALNGVKSVTISFNYNASAVTGLPNYISLGLAADKAQAITKTNTWNNYSATFNSVPANFIISVSNLADSAYSGSAVTGTLYVSNVTYTVNYSTGVYATFATEEEVNANTKIWVGTRSSSNVKQYNGKNSLSITNTTAGGRYGCILSKEKLTALLALNGATSVTISFNYNASAVTGIPNFINLGLIADKAQTIVKSDTWNTYSATFNSVPTNFILSVSNLADSAYSGSGVTGTLYIGDITYTVNY